MTRAERRFWTLISGRRSSVDAAVSRHPAERKKQQ